MDGPRIQQLTTISFVPASAPNNTPKASEDAAQKPENISQRCMICNSPFNLTRSDGLIEKESILPCSHVFGHICIQRWLETDSTHQDCPICRRPMLYRTCGHVIKSCEVDKAPSGLPEEDMPDKCARCRIGDSTSTEVEGPAEEELREGRKMIEARERALEGMRRHLPGILGGMSRSTVQSVDARIEDLRNDWGMQVDAAFGELEEKHGRLEW